MKISFKSLKLLEEKFAKADQPTDWIRGHLDFAHFMVESKLLSQLKITRDRIQIHDKIPSLLVSGIQTSANEILKRFETCYSPSYKTVFLRDQNTKSVYTYLDNGKGLQEYHPFQSVGRVPISRLKDEELERLKTIAKKFIQPQEETNKQRPFILQIVSNHTEKGTSNFSQTLLNPRHSFLRLVATEDLSEFNIKKGDVYEFGFGWEHKVRFPFVFAPQGGGICSPDPWEYISAKRYVTNIPICEENACSLLKFVLGLHHENIQFKTRMNFQLLEQNCTSFVREAVKSAGIEIPTEITIPQLLIKILPDFLKQIGQKISQATDATVNCLHTYTPNPVGQFLSTALQKIKTISTKALSVLVTFTLFTPIRLALSGLQTNETSWWNRLKKCVHYPCNLPFVLQEWQKHQASTEVYPEDTRKPTPSGVG